MKRLLRVKLLIIILRKDLIEGLMIEEINRKEKIEELVEENEIEKEIMELIEKIGGIGKKVGREMRDMKKKVKREEEVKEREEIGGIEESELIDLEELRLRKNGVNKIIGGLDLIEVRRRDIESKIVIDVDIGEGILKDIEDKIEEGENKVEDIVGRNVNKLDERGKIEKLRERGGDGIGNLEENVKEEKIWMLKREINDILGDKVDIDVNM